MFPFAQNSVLCLLSTLVLGAALMACTPQDPDPLMPPDAEWTLVFEDDFEGPPGRSPDETKWTYDLGATGWGNDELQEYTNLPENVSLDGRGRLDITAMRNDGPGAPWTSARIKTQGLFEHGYGRFEARIRLPQGRGIWPAFWMLGNDIEDVGWPQCGEIDILELRGSNPFRVLGTLHGPGYSGGNSLGGTIDSAESLADDFHVYRVDVEPDRLWWYLDDQLYWTVSRGEQPPGTEWVVDHPFFFILNVAVGGNFVLPPTDDTPSPAVMKIDYVRAYERSEGYGDSLGE